MDDKRLIEVDFPLKDVSEESAREKSIRHGHISTLHIWWARRPLAASRATAFAALIPAPKNDSELRKELKFVTKLSKWENSLNLDLMREARKAIEISFGGKTPKVLDCFAGGGAIPLEALRLGCETYALEYNPVAVLILKAVLEYPQKYGENLVEDVKKWGRWVYEEAQKEIGIFYPEESISVQKALSESGGEKYIPAGYIWARTIRCQNPSCQVEIPLMRQLWLVRKENKKIALRVIADKKNKKINFEIVQGKKIDFNPSQGTTKRATVLCPACGSGMSGKTLRKEARNGNMGQRLVAVMLFSPRRRRKIYRTANANDIEVFRQAEQHLQDKIKDWKWDLSPIPNEPTPSGEGPGAERAFSVRKYGLDEWGDLFNCRQKLALITFVEKIRLAYESMTKNRCDEEYAKAITTYLGLNFDIFATYLCSLARYRGDTQSIERSFDRQTIQMVWDYGEANPFGRSRGDWNRILSWASKAITHCSKVSSNSGMAVLGTATRLPYPDNSLDAVITDPPYYDNVPYSNLSDFFYVWLKRTIGDLHPDLFSTPLTPKSQEIIVHTLRHGNSFDKAKKFFEDMITKSFSEIHRVLKSDGIVVIVFAYKSTDAWETIINSLLESGLVLTASWPIHTEMKTRLRAMESAALASSVYMVCKKRTKEKIAYFNEIREEIETRIREKLTQFWEQGISGADFFVSAIGPAVEVFGKYSKVEKLSGEEVSVQELLEYVRRIVSEFALERVLKRADLGGVDAETRFYLLWRWTFGNAKVHFDDAIKLSRPMGIELTDIWDRGEFVKKEKEFIRVFGPKERVKDSSFMKMTKFVSMIDALHRVLISWERGEKKKINEILDETGYARNEIFWQTAQAISEILPEGDKEKQLLQGFLYGKEAYIRGAKRRKRTLFEFMESD
jgi:adenine-specific DNA methylase